MYKRQASKKAIAYARENQNLCGLNEAPIRWIVEDALKFVEREIRRGNKYDGIILDPPKHGRGPNGEVFKLEESLFELLNSCVQLLSDDALFMAVSYTHLDVYKRQHHQVRAVILRYCICKVKMPKR